VLALLASLAAAGCDGSGGAGLGIFPADNGGPAVVELRPEAASYRTGEVVTLEVAIENGKDVGSVPFHLHFDPAVLQFLPPGTEGPFLSADGTTTVFLADESSAGGELVVGMSRFGAPVGARGSGSLARFDFLSLGPGAVDFRFSAASVRDPRAEILPATFQAATVEVAP